MRKKEREVIIMKLTKTNFDGYSESEMAKYIFENTGKALIMK